MAKGSTKRQRSPQIQKQPTVYIDARAITARKEEAALWQAKMTPVWLALSGTGIVLARIEEDITLSHGRMSDRELKLALQKKPQALAASMAALETAVGQADKDFVLHLSEWVALCKVLYRATQDFLIDKIDGDRLREIFAMHAVGLDRKLADVLSAQTYGGQEEDPAISGLCALVHPHRQKLKWRPAIAALRADIAKLSPDNPVRARWDGWYEYGGPQNAYTNLTRNYNRWVKRNGTELQVSDF